jgi:hypothetical protein
MSEISEAEMLKKVKKPLEDLYQNFNKQEPKSFIGLITNMLQKFGEAIGVKSPRVQKIVNKTIKRFVMQQKKNKLNKFVTKNKAVRRKPPKITQRGISI